MDMLVLLLLELVTVFTQGHNEIQAGHELSGYYNCDSTAIRLRLDYDEK